MTDTPPQGPTREKTNPAAHSPASRLILPLWIAALSLAVIAVVLSISSVQLLHAVNTIEALLLQLQQQVQQLEAGLGGLLGG